MRLSFWLNATGLTIGFIGALVIGFFPPKMQEYNPDGSEKSRLLLNSEPTAKGKFWVKWYPRLAIAGPCLLALAFLLQFVALFVP